MVTVRRSYKVGLRFDGENPRHKEKQANAIIRRDQEIVRDKIIDQNMVDHAYELLDSNPGLSGTRGARRLAKKVGDNSNIGQVSTTYALAAVNGAIERERKLATLFDLFEQYPHEAVSWLFFHRTPFLEGLLGRRHDVSYEYSRNLVFSAGRNMTAGYADLILPELSEDDFIDALDGKTAQISDVLEERNAAGEDTSRLERFYNKLQVLKQHDDLLGLCLFHWYELMRYSKRGYTDEKIPSRWKSLKQLSRNFIDMADADRRYSRLFSAIRAVVVHALSTNLIGTVKNLCETVTIRALVAKPFRKVRNALAPVNLIMGSEYVVTRPGNGKVLTDLAVTDGEFSLGIRDPDRRGRTIEATVMIHDRLHRMLERGAVITSLSIRSGKPPAHKIIVTVNLKGDRQAFATTRFLDDYDDLVVEQSDIVGLDINKVGPHMMTFSQQIKLPDELVTICDRYLKLEDEISRLSAVVEKTRSVKHRGELDRVHRRRANLMAEIRNQCKLLATAVLVQTGASTLRVEELELTARGSRGALAKAIISMPDDLDIFEQAVLLAASFTGRDIKLEAVNPRNTSKVHHGCGGKLLRDKRNWDIARCRKCGEKVMTHRNAALHVRDGGVVD